MVRIGLIGTLTQSLPHVEILKKVPGVDIAGLFNPLKELSGTSQSNGYIKEFDSFSQFIPRVDAIDFVSKSQNCFNIAKQALKETKHIFISTSILKNKQQAGQLINLANEASVILMVERPVRYHAALNAVLPQIKNLRLIEIHNQFYDKLDNSRESIFRAIMTDIEIIYTVLQANVKDVKACGIKMANINPDVISIRLEFDNACVANLNCSRITPENNHYGLFTQQDSITRIDFLTNEITVIKPKKNRHSVDDDYALNPVTRKIIPNNPILDELINFVISITNNSKLLSKPEDGFKSLYLAEKIMDSINKVSITA
ncbi:MAG: Gfo/Idh/MocA family oxidoreductase [Bacteroidales bacterium]|nr:Gfo/Idh/MocA family oxidoreductase [Bacteroidales bacterium]